MAYRGRFAPSPSGRLHFGSLLTAYAALLRAREQHGSFIVRLEDLDFPRCPKVNTPMMLEELSLFNLYSDEKLLMQSRDLSPYLEAIDYLVHEGYAYYCTCTRAQIKERPCPCEHLHLKREDLEAQGTHYAIRINLEQHLKQLPLFYDINLGEVRQDKLGYDLPSSLVLRRSDEIIAYNLAVVIDDHRQGISEVVRGADMLDATFLQLALYDLFGWKAPDFCHVPLIVNQDGNKFSKQNHSPAVIYQATPYQALKQCICILQPHLESLIAYSDAALELEDCELQLIQLLKQVIVPHSVPFYETALNTLLYALSHDLSNEPSVHYKADGHADIAGNTKPSKALPLSLFEQGRMLAVQLPTTNDIVQTLGARYYDALNDFIAFLSPRFEVQAMPKTPVML